MEPKMSPAEAKEIERFCCRHKLIQSETDDGQGRYELTRRGRDVAFALMYLLELDEIRAIAIGQEAFRRAWAQQLDQDPIEINPN